MIITIAFDIKNYVEVMEGWPITIDNTSFHLERNENTVTKVCISYSKVGIENAPQITHPTENGAPTRVNIKGGAYARLAIEQIMTWQAVVSDLQIFDIDFDDYELQFRPENIEEQKQIHITSYRSIQKGHLNSACDFEQIGRAFCVGPIDAHRIESVSHFREGRIAHEAGRYVDAYNNMFLFLETRYCDEKTKTAQQVELLSKTDAFTESLEHEILELRKNGFTESEHLKGMFSEHVDIRTKISSIVLLRGKLRHHSLKSPQRWDPNKQSEYEIPARFLGVVVGHIVLSETLDNIYAPETLRKFRDISISSGHETKINISTARLTNQPTLALELSYPVTTISSQLSIAAAKESINACKKDGQIHDTVRIEATQNNNNLELFTLELGIWAYTQSRNIQTDNTQNSIRCSFEHFQSNIVLKHEFSFLTSQSQISIEYAWHLLQHCFDWIEQKDPTTRIFSLKIFLNERSVPIVRYRVGAQIKH
ncbi:hypothetical protein [Pseudomonas costantinii]|uniref:hypothetical protein n=1 Tax=Pseudomonas costantinii TaxID=168469 RepID=UPI00159F77EC|nr:hypothetical protein [Pseudomonas costantinii]NVZ72523.1 hypothetical protein [Pseudomonas costantinii]